MTKQGFRRGGLHVPDHKNLSEKEAIRELPLPPQVFIALNQHLGKAAKPVVEAKQEVSVGQLLAEADGFVSAHVHSSVSGKIKKIEKRLTPGGSFSPTVIIDVDAEKTLQDSKIFDTPADFDFDKAERDFLLDKIRMAGIVGAGGAAFPMHVKLSPPPEKNVHTLIVNGAECEPFLTADHRLMLEKTREILRGIAIVHKILPIQKTYIGIELNKPDAIAAFENEIAEQNLTGIQVVGLRPRYPQGGEKQLIEAILGKEVPSGKLPFDLGVLVQNIGTLYAAYLAVFYNRPFMERVVTVTGFVKQPGNFWLKIGTPFAYATEAGAQGFKDSKRVKEVLNGGPMMGKAVRQLDVSIMKGSSGIVVLSDSDYSYGEEKPCLRCSRCVEICPMGLMPLDLANGAIFKHMPLLQDSFDCIECGSCSYVCPTHRKLVHWIRVGKDITRKELRKKSS